MIRSTLFGLAFLLFLSTVLAQSQTVGTFTNSDDALDGYTTIFPYNSNTIFLINNCGQQVHSWQTSTPTLIAYLLPDGDLLKAGLDSFPAFGNPGLHGILQRYSWDGNLEWEYKISNDSMILHHDIEMMPNGNILAIAWKQIMPEQLREMGRDSMHPASMEPMWEEVILEIKPLGSDDAQIVWEWHVIDHLVQDYAPNKANYGVVADHPEKLNINYQLNGAGKFSDWLHFNSIDYNPTLDQILISCLTFNEMYIIDHSVSDPSGGIGGNHGNGGDIIYRWGNPAAYDQGTVSDKKFFGQHDPNWILYGDHAGKILVYNNGNSRGFSTVEIINPPMNGNKYSVKANGTYGPDNAEFTYSKTPANALYSQTMSGAEILDNGNILITESNKGKITEYDMEDDEIVWEYINPAVPNNFTTQGNTPIGNWIFRSYKYASNYPAFNGRNITVGDPLELDPWPTECNGIDTTTQDTTNNQDTTQDSTAFVKRLHVQGSYNAIYPNPSTGKVYLKDLPKIDALYIQDLSGRTIEQHHNNELKHCTSLDLSGLPKGLYIVRYTLDDQTLSQRLVLQ